MQLLNEKITLFNLLLNFTDLQVDNFWLAFLHTQADLVKNSVFSVQKSLVVRFKLVFK